MLSSTVTVAVHVELFPASSVTVSVTVLAPTCEQSNAVWSTVMLVITPLSVLPPSMSAATMLAFPEASSAMVTS